MKVCEYCEFRFADERYMFCPYCGLELSEYEEIVWDRPVDEIAENGVRIEPQSNESSYGYETLE